MLIILIRSFDVPLYRSMNSFWYHFLFCEGKSTVTRHSFIQMPPVLTTRAIHSPTIFFSAQNDGKERNGNHARRQSLKPSSSNDRSSKGQQRYQQISTSIGKPTKDIVIARENIGTTVSLTAAAFGIGITRTPG